MAGYFFSSTYQIKLINRRGKAEAGREGVLQPKEGTSSMAGPLQSSQPYHRLEVAHWATNTLV